MHNFGKYISKTDFGVPVCVVTIKTMFWSENTKVTIIQRCELNLLY